MGQWEEGLVLPSACLQAQGCAHPVWQRSASSCRQDGAAPGRGISRSLCLLPKCSYAGLLAELRVFLSVCCAFGAQSAWGWLVEPSTTLALPATPSCRCGGTILTLKILLDVTGYLNQPCLDTSGRKERM